MLFHSKLMNVYFWPCLLIQVCHFNKGTEFAILGMELNSACLPGWYFIWKIASQSSVGFGALLFRNSTNYILSDFKNMISAQNVY